MGNIVKEGLDPRSGIIKFPVWMIPFSVSQTDFTLLRPNGKHFVKEVICAKCGS